jgi:predicted nucleic acid-binding protein
MGMQLLISDTNIIIDLDVCRLIRKMFDLPYTFAVPDILYIEELEEQHRELPAYGLQIKALGAEMVNHAVTLQERYLKTSANDLFALVLAKQENCPLLTGDGALRDLASMEQIEIRGTIWIIEQMIKNGIIDSNHAKKAFKTMKENNRRLPWKEAENMLKRVQE